MIRHSLLYIYIIFSAVASATWFRDIPRTLTQPDGNTVQCLITGDQYVRRLHDQNDYTIILNQQDGYYYYAELSGHQLIPTIHKVGSIDPADAGLIPGLSVGKDVYQRQRSFYAREGSSRNGRDAPTSGEIAQVNIFIRFADDPEFPEPRSFYDAPFNLDDQSSLKNYYWEVSYNSLMVTTYHYPGSINDINTAYVDIHDRGYYEPYSPANPDGYEGETQRTQREHTLLMNAVESIAENVSPLIDIDANDDGYVDATSFVIYGNPGDWADLLWPHRWALYSEYVYINGARVYDYLFMLSESWYFNVGVLCHEFFHVLGAPDLYHYDGGGAPSPVGAWDVMESNTDPPQYMGAFMKWKYGDWIPEFPEITTSGTYTLSPLQEQENVLYKIPSPNSETEYFVIEYRKKEGLYDINTPGTRSGMLVYRINPDAGNGNASGPPDEIYLYRPGGTLSNNGNFNNAPYNAEYGHTQINDDTNPSSFLYNNGAGGEGGLNILNVTEADETISFFVSLGNPSIEITPDNLEFIMEPDDFASQPVYLTNSGDDMTTLSFDLVTSGPVPYTNPGGGPDGGNYYWSDTNLEQDLVYDWIDVEGMSIQLEFPHNDQAADPVDIGFDFPFFDEQYSECIVNPNGWIGFGDDNTGWENAQIPSPSAPRPSILGMWDDLNPNNNIGNGSPSGDVYFYPDPNGQYFVVWWDDVVRWNPDYYGEFDFQIVLYIDGRFRVNYREMQGITNSGTIGYQNGPGTEGTMIAFDQNYVEDGLTLEVDQTGTVDWITLGTETGQMSGQVTGGESFEISVMVNTEGMGPGEYEGAVNVMSDQTQNVSLPVELIVTGDSQTPSLPFIDISGSEDGIVPLPDTVDPLFLAVAERYTHILAPNGDVIPILIQDELTVDQILHARRVLGSYLTDIPGSTWGNNKAPITNAMALSNAILFLLNDEDEYENPDLWELMDAGVDGQDLLGTEIFPEGSGPYMNSSERDATYEEVLHFVHGFGIQNALSAMQNAIMGAMSYAIGNDFYNPLWDLPEEDQDEEYLAMGLECYFGIWAHDPNGDGWCGDHEYAFNTRDEMEAGDPALFGIIEGFLGDVWEYTAHLPEGLSGDFTLSWTDDHAYSNRSQYLTDIVLSGTNTINLTANAYRNIIMGNDGSNLIFGGGDDDIIDGYGGVDRAIYTGDYGEYAVLLPAEWNDSNLVVMDLVPDRDGMDSLFHFEELEFNGTVYTIESLLGMAGSGAVPNEYALLPNYPNPFNPSTHIRFHLPLNGHTRLEIIDLMGRNIRSIKNNVLPAGIYDMDWDGRTNNGDMATAGIYFIRMVSAQYQNTRKIILLK